jgi:hypothetical protein
VLIFASGMAAGVSRGANGAAAVGVVARDGGSVAAGRGATGVPATGIPVAAPANGFAPASVRAAADVAERVTPRDLAVVEQRLRAEMAQIHTASAPAAARRPDEALLREVRVLIAESEQRQRNDVTVRLAQSVRTAEKQRQVDMTQVQWTMWQLQELTGAALRDQGMKVNMALRGASFAR